MSNKKPMADSAKQSQMSPISKNVDNELAVLDMEKPQEDTQFAHESAKLLVDIVKKNNWAMMLGGKKAHLVYEAWQTVGKYYGYTVKTGEAEEVTIGGVTGFKAKAWVVNERTGVTVGGADAYCMKDEANWKAKPLFQLASMAQTRAGSKALRQILGFVVALAGYEATPAEEMTPIKTEPEKIILPPMTDKQRNFIFSLLEQKGKTKDDLDIVCDKLYSKRVSEIDVAEAKEIIERLLKLADSTAANTEEGYDEPEIDIDEVDKGIDQMKLERKEA